MIYPVAIHNDARSDYGVSVPDLPGCFSAGETVEEALKNAVEAIECHVEGLLVDGEPVPPSQPIEQHKSKNKGAVWALVTVDLSKLSGKAKRINITLPERILNQIDLHLERRGESRSGFLAQAAIEAISRDVQRD